jgi:Ner family transcriptional regulator
MGGEKVPDTEPERTEWLKYQLRLKGYSLAKLSLEIGAHRDTLKSVLHSRYPRMEEVIAKKLGRKPWEIWRERYDKRRTPVRLRCGRPPKATHPMTGSRPSPPHKKNEKAKA